MSGEKLNQKNHQEKLPGNEASNEQAEKIKSNLEKEARSAEKHGSKEIKETRKTIESEALSGKESLPGTGENQDSQQSITKAEKTRTYKMTMGRMQGQLSSPSRTFSKIIHNPVVEKTSAVVGTTVARPSGVLGAGIAGFVGITLVMYLARKNGFEIANSYSLVAVLFIGGWLLGLLFEFLIKVLRKAR